MSKPILYDYWRSSAAYRVRIALNLKGIEYVSRPVNLLTQEHKGELNMARNPQGLVPVLEIDGLVLTQSLPIIEYLDETRPDVPLLPGDAVARHRVRSIACAIAMEIHPVTNLSVVTHVAELSGAEGAKEAWMRRFNQSGLAAVEAMVANGQTGGFCHLDTPTLADCCLMPQLYNARRWGVDLAPFPALRHVEEHCGELNAFQMAYPDAVKPD